MPADNKHRVWAFGTPRLVKQMPQVKTVAVGFYAINGTSVLRSLESLHKEWISDVFEAFHEQNLTGQILLVLDNLSSYTCAYTRKKADELGISPPSCITTSLANRTGLEQPQAVSLVEAAFLDLTQRLSFADDWLETFIDINYLR